ncbi:response regulator transcription factor [Primorskyibacter sedentarius]|uniref:Response regulator receiver domain-containing protein n=1 Tax=Primorskyibacter sedentarius TaxID=745311 RepID=A0A4R3J8W9_9RHOB|nr:response regulator [Primorskyibacter sedentarius]TCS61907.1 response regulator receiver domain-containing protein [Primorskyibacter sedentarius]
MNVLIVESKAELGKIWKSHLERLGAEVWLVTTQDDAVNLLRTVELDVLVLDLVIDDGSAMAIADFASYRQPKAKAIFVTNTSFFSDGSIFQHCSNACAYLQSETPPDDLAAMVEHYGRNEQN